MSHRRLVGQIGLDWGGNLWGYAKSTFGDNKKNNRKVLEAEDAVQRGLEVPSSEFHRECTFFCVVSLTWETEVEIEISLVRTR